MRVIFLLVVATCSYVGCQQFSLNYTLRSVAGAGAGICPDTQDLRKAIEQDIHSLINSSVLSELGIGPGYGACSCGVLDGEELPISICPTQHRLVHQLGSSLLLQEDPVLDLLLLATTRVIQLCSLLKAFGTLRSVEKSLDISLDNQKHSLIVEGVLLMNAMLME